MWGGTNMKYIKSILSKFVIVFVLFLIISFQNTPAYADTNTSFVQEDTKSTEGTVPESQDLNQESGDRIFTDNVRKILPNKLGLERVNEYRSKQGLSELNIDTCEFGDEILKKETDTLSKEIPVDYLPSSADNSQLKSFPPIGTQGKLNTCASFATTYYQMTHMFGMKLGWDAKNDPENKRKFSPRWTFNLSNNGDNGVLGLQTAYEIFAKSGAALWNDFPYNGYDKSLENYTAWPTDASIWRSALNYRIKDFGYIRIFDGSDTPVESPHSTSLNKVKQLLNNGYVLTFETNLSTWRYSKISDDISTSEDNAYINQNIAHITDKQKISMDLHVMTLVGYNDNIWVDINENGIVDLGERGAFKIANSWGTNLQPVIIGDEYEYDYCSNDGFLWLSYDALNKVSSVPESPVSERNNAINWGNKIHWICPKEAATPKLLIEYTVNHANKYELVATIGYSNYDVKSPVSFFALDIINLPSHIRTSFNGTSNSCDATFVFDISELYDRFDSTKGNLYLSLFDRMEGNPCTLKNVKVIDNVSDQTYYYDGELPTSFDNTRLTIGPISFNKKLTGLKGIKLVSADMPTQREAPAVVSLNDKIYVISGVQDSPGYTDKCKKLNDVEVYDPETCSWEKKNDLTGEQESITKVACVNNKIYAIKSLASGENIIEEYDADSDKWIYKTNLNDGNIMFVGQTNGKIYIIGSKNGISKENTIPHIEEYDTVSNTVTEETYMEKGITPDLAGFMDGKIYLFDFDKRLRVYDIRNKSWNIGKYIDINGAYDITTVDDKFYIFWRDRVSECIRISEYNPSTDTLKDFEDITMDIYNFGITTYKGNIITLGGCSNTYYRSLITLSQSEFAKVPVQIITTDYDKIPPVLEAPADLIISTKEELTAVDIGMADSFGNSAVKVTNNAPEAFPLGTTNVLWSAEDEAGNKTYAVQKVTVVIDKEPPELVIPNDIIIGTNTDNKNVEIGEATASDLFDVYVTNDAPQSFQLGKTIVNWVAVDANGNKTSKAQQINVYKFGDTNGDGETNAIDFAQLRLLLLGYTDTLPYEFGKYAADVDGNNSINAIDFAIMRKYLLGYINKFSVGIE